MVLQVRGPNRSVGCNLPMGTPFIGRWNNPLIRTSDPNFQRHIQVGRVFVPFFPLSLAFRQFSARSQSCGPCTLSPSWRLHFWTRIPQMRYFHGTGLSFLTYYPKFCFILRWVFSRKFALNMDLCTNMWPMWVGVENCPGQSRTMPRWLAHVLSHIAYFWHWKQTKTIVFTVEKIKNT